MKRFSGRYGSILLTLSVVLVLGLLTMPVSTAFWSQILGISGSINTGNWDHSTPTPTSPPGRSGTSISAEVTAAGFMDTEANNAWVNGEVCVKNDGDVTTSALQVIGQVQYSAKSGFQPLGDSFVINVADQLKPGETGCYDYEAFFTPVETDKYRLSAAVSITNHSGWLPGGNHCPGPEVCAYGPDVKVVFELTEKAPIARGFSPIEPTPTGTIDPTTLTVTIEPTPTETPVPTQPTGTIDPTQPTVTPEPIQPIVTVEPTPTETPVPTSTETPVPTPTATPEPSPTATPVPTPTVTIEPLPTATIAPASTEAIAPPPP